MRQHPARRRGLSRRTASAGAIAGAVAVLAGTVALHGTRGDEHALNPERQAFSQPTADSTAPTAPARKIEQGGTVGRTTATTSTDDGRTTDPSPRVGAGSPRSASATTPARRPWASMPTATSSVPSWTGGVADTASCGSGAGSGPSTSRPPGTPSSPEGAWPGPSPRRTVAPSDSSPPSPAETQ